MRHLRPQIWNIVTQNIRESSSLKEFKSLIEFWEPNTCFCRLCKNYIAQVALFDFICIGTICLSFSIFFFLVGVN